MAVCSRVVVLLRSPSIAGLPFQRNDRFCRVHDCTRSSRMTQRGDRLSQVAVSCRWSFLHITLNRFTISRLEFNWFGVFEHGSTHVDAPAHYHRGGRHVHEIPPDQLIGPGVMIDIRASLGANRDYLMTIQDILVSLCNLSLSNVHGRPSPFKWTSAIAAGSR